MLFRPFAAFCIFSASCFAFDAQGPTYAAPIPFASLGDTDVTAIVNGILESGSATPVFASLQVNGPFVIHGEQDCFTADPGAPPSFPCGIAFFGGDILSVSGDDQDSLSWPQSMLLGASLHAMGNVSVDSSLNTVFLNATGKAFFGDTVQFPFGGESDNNPLCVDNNGYTGECSTLGFLGDAVATASAIADPGSTDTLAATSFVYQASDSLNAYIERSTTAVQTNFSTSPVNLVMDIDIGEDIDDVGSMAEALNLADSGKVNLLAMTYVGTHNYGAPDLSAINTFYSQGTIPIGTQKTPGYTGTDYYGTFLTEYPNRIHSGISAPDAVALYRKIMVGAPDNSITFLFEGDMTNLYWLYNSPADSISPLTGAQLMIQKTKLLDILGGLYPSSAGVPEHDFSANAAASQVINQLSSQITTVFGGGEFGLNVLTKSNQPWWSPVYASYQQFFSTFGGTNRPSWGALNVLYCVYGLSHGSDTYFSLSAAGTNTVTDTLGNNTFSAGGSKQQHYLILSMNPDTLASRIQNWMDTLPQGTIPPAELLNSSGRSGWGSSIPNNLIGVNDGEIFQRIENASAGTNASEGLTFVNGGGGIAQIAFTNYPYSGGYGSIPSALNIINRGGSPIYFKTDGTMDDAVRVAIADDSTTITNKFVEEGNVGSGGSVEAVINNSNAGGYANLLLVNSGSGGRNYGLVSGGSGVSLAGYFQIFDSQIGNRLTIDPFGNVNLNQLGGWTYLNNDSVTTNPIMRKAISDTAAILGRVDSGTVTDTVTGMTATVTTKVHYHGIKGLFYTITIDSASGTSNSNAMTIQHLLSKITPSSTRTFTIPGVYAVPISTTMDYNIAQVAVSNTGVMTLSYSLAGTGLTAFPTSGFKGFTTFTFTVDLN